VFLKVKEKSFLIRLGSCTNLEAIYCVPFEILEKIGLVAYILTLYAYIRVHNIFHVSLLKKNIVDPNHIIDWNVIQVEHEGDFRVEPICILDQKFKVLRKKSIGMVKVRWTYYNPENATWEHAENIREEYPQIFDNFEEGRMQNSILSS
jgi:hypothetical protein